MEHINFRERVGMFFSRDLRVMRQNRTVQIKLEVTNRNTIDTEREGKRI